jgi:hypothetical protein
VSQRKANVLQEILCPPTSPNLATHLLQLASVAKTPARGARRPCVSEVLALAQLLSAKLSVESHLLIELGTEPLAVGPILEATPQLT